MIKTFISMLITLAIIIGFSTFEIFYVQNTFSHFHSILQSLHQKTEDNQVTYEDGKAVISYWDNKKSTLHVWLPHTSLQEIDYQLNEAVGYLYIGDYKNAIPKLEILMTISTTIPESYSIGVGNIF